MGIVRLGCLRYVGIVFGWGTFLTLVFLVHLTITIHPITMGVSQVNQILLTNYVGT